ncbi:hypothetical protein [Streptomyces sp. 7N604]|uniref:hypothetical protein n=1 Tax=Streptomyces sp. 7N604 TaxID=3457415 RepID=UPI003FD37231
MTLTADTITAERLEELLADQSIPVVHRTLWLLLWEGEVPVLELLSLDVGDVALDSFGERATALLSELIGDRDAGPLFSVGSRSLSWEEAVQAASDQGHGIHAFRTGGKRSRQP